MLFLPCTPSSLFFYTLFLLCFLHNHPRYDKFTIQLYYSFFFFLNDRATTEIYPLPLHDPLPILTRAAPPLPLARAKPAAMNPAPCSLAGTTSGIPEWCSPL